MIIHRDIVDKAKKCLNTDEVLIFTGARQVGKTVISKQLQQDLDSERAKTYFINLEDPDYLKQLNESPKNLFKLISLLNEKKVYIFIDEIQYLDNPTNFIKYIYDEYHTRLKLIVSGSSAFYIDKKFKDSLAGRKKIFNVRTLSFREFLDYKGTDISTASDLKSLSLIEQDKLKILLEDYIIYGGYPKVVLADTQDEKREVLKELAYSYIKKDIFEAGIKQDDAFYRLFKTLSMQVGNLVNTTELAGLLGVSKTAIDNYLYTMKKSFHIDLIKPMFKNVRKELTKMPKVHFLDLGLRNFFSNNFEMFNFRTDKGMLFENIIYRFLIDKYDDTSIKYWRTQDGKEVDFVLEDKNMAFEAKAKFRKNKFKTFSENYPEFIIKILSFDDFWKSII